MTGSAFVRRYGWRAYALPALVIATIICLLNVGESGRPSSAQARRSASSSVPSDPSVAAAPPVATGVTSIKTDTPSAGSRQEALASDALPAGPAYTESGAGTFQVLPGTSPVIGTGTVHRFTVEVEQGITGVDPKQFAATVQTVLSDRRSWTGHNSGVALQRVDSGSPDFRVTLTSAMTVRKLCGYEVHIETSCWAPDAGRVVINIARWVRGDAAYLNNIELYRTYLVNHEDGHAIGHQHAHQCLANGLAPVMMQQTIGLKSVTGQMCQDNVWPYPDGASDAPGAEQPDTAANDESVLIGEH